MNEAAIREKLIELTDALRLAPVQGQVAKGSQNFTPQQTHESLEQAMDHLSLQIKYTAFDLEATRRENRYLRQMLESRPRPNLEDGEMNQ